MGDTLMYGAASILCLTSEDRGHHRGLKAGRGAEVMRAYPGDLSGSPRSICSTSANNTRQQR